MTLRSSTVGLALLLGGVAAGGCGHDLSAQEAPVPPTREAPGPARPRGPEAATPRPPDPLRPPRTPAAPREKTPAAPGLLPAGEAVDDEAILDALTTAAAEAADTATPAPQLWSQLDRASCRLTLPPPGERALAAGEVYRAARASTLVLAAFRRGRDGRPPRIEFGGAAFPITGDGVVVTSHHLVAPAYKRPRRAERPGVDFYGVMTEGGDFAPVTEVLACDEGQDVAILRVAGPGLTPLPLGPPPEVGRWVGVLSHPDFRFFTFQPGHVTRRYTIPVPVAGEPVSTVWLSTTCELAEGSSGGPLLDERGNVVGIAAFTETVFAVGHLAPPSRRADPLTVTVPPAETQMVVRSFCPVEAIRALIEPAE